MDGEPTKEGQSTGEKKKGGNKDLIDENLDYIDAVLENAQKSPHQETYYNLPPYQEDPIVYDFPGPNSSLGINICNKKSLMRLEQTPLKNNKTFHNLYLYRSIDL
ncbi:MAG: hypothetical protein EOO20_20320 [Chryseobacterium sp.]|nr:MAG: hypothetical protein EOO20_20320 [Chryseobacterium sp.]